MEALEDHKFNNRFKVTGNVVKKVNKWDAWMNFMFSNELKPGNKYILDVEILHSPQRFVNLGVGTCDLVDELNTRSYFGFITFSCYSGEVWAGGDKKSKNPNSIVGAGQKVRMHVDMI